MDMHFKIEIHIVESTPVYIVPRKAQQVRDLDARAQALEFFDLNFLPQEGTCPRCEGHEQNETFECNSSHSTYPDQLVCSKMKDFAR